MNETDREEYENVLILHNVVEADLMGKLLDEEGIAYFVRLWQDVNFDGMFAEQKGYAWLMGRRVDEERIKSIYSDRVSAD